MKFCPTCGTRLAEAARFCAACGAALSTPAVDQPPGIGEGASVPPADRGGDVDGADARRVFPKRLVAFVTAAGLLATVLVGVAVAANEDGDGGQADQPAAVTSTASPPALLAPVDGGACAPDRVGQHTVASDPELVCTALDGRTVWLSAGTPRWALPAEDLVGSACGEWDAISQRLNAFAITPDYWTEHVGNARDFAVEAAGKDSGFATFADALDTLAALRIPVGLEDWLRGTRLTFASWATHYELGGRDVFSVVKATCTQYPYLGGE